MEVIWTRSPGYRIRIQTTDMDSEGMRYEESVSGYGLLIPHAFGLGLSPELRPLSRSQCATRIRTPDPHSLWRTYAVSGCSCCSITSFQHAIVVLRICRSLRRHAIIFIIREYSYLKELVLYRCLLLVILQMLRFVTCECFAWFLVYHIYQLVQIRIYVSD